MLTVSSHFRHYFSRTESEIKESFSTLHLPTTTYMNLLEIVKNSKEETVLTHCFLNISTNTVFINLLTL